MFNESESIRGVPQEEIGFEETSPFFDSEKKSTNDPVQFEIERAENMTVPQLEKFLKALDAEHSAVWANHELSEEEKSVELRRIVENKFYLYQELEERKKTKMSLDSLFEELIAGYELDPEHEWEKENILHDPKLTEEQRIEKIKVFVSKLPTEFNISTNLPPRSKAA
jgi:lipase chaperone LimK